MQRKRLKWIRSYLGYSYFLEWLPLIIPTAHLQLSTLHLTMSPKGFGFLRRKDGRRNGKTLSLALLLMTHFYGKSRETAKEKVTWIKCSCQTTVMDITRVKNPKYVPPIHLKMFLQPTLYVQLPSSF